MGQRILRTLGLIACGFSMQLLGCQSDNIGEIIAAHARDTAVEIGSFVIESAFDHAFAQGDAG